MAEEATVETTELPAAMNVDATADHIDSLNIFGFHDDTSDEAPTEDAPATETAQETTETVDESPAEKPAAEDTPDEQGALTLQSIADRFEIEVDDLYGLEVATKIDGEEGTATLGDLTKSYQLGGNYTNKSKQLKAEYAQRETEFTEREEARTQAVEGILSIARAELMQNLNAVNWEELKANDPETYATTFIDFQRREAQINTAIDQFNAQKQESLTKQQGEFKEWVESQDSAVIDLIPTWADNAIKTEEQGHLKSYLVENAFSESEIAGIYDARQVNIVRKAMLWDKLQAKKPALEKKVKTAPKAVKSGKQAAAPDAKAKGAETLEAARKKAFTGRSNVNEIAELLASRGIV